MQSRGGEAIPSTTSAEIGIFDLSVNEEYKGKEVNGRYPANTILTYDNETFDEVCGGFPDTKVRQNDNEFDDNGSACRYYYSAKASSRDREEGLENFEPTRGGDIQIPNRRKPRWTNSRKA